MQLDLNGKKAIVTGGSRGLCRSIAEALHDSGAEVVIVGHSEFTEKADKRNGNFETSSLCSDWKFGKQRSTKGKYLLNV